LVATAAAHEVEEVATIRGEVGAAFVDPAPKPLAELELVGLAVPADGADRVDWAPSEHDAHWGL
jgi:hypothetical protein